MCITVEYTKRERSMPINPQGMAAHHSFIRVMVRGPVKSASPSPESEQRGKPRMTVMGEQCCC